MDNHCYVNRCLENTSDLAFMGFTHALSAIAVLLAIFAFFPDLIPGGVSSIGLIVSILFVVNASGAALSNDLDNTSSTSKSSLGILGEILSVVFRATSTVIQTTIRTKRDDSSPNPHRGFYHTIPAAALIGFLIYLGTRIPGSISLPILGTMSYGFLFALLITWLNIHMMLAAVAKKIVNKIKKSAGFFGDFAAFVFSLTIAIYLFTLVPKTSLTDFTWLGLAVFVGMVIHILGDSFTTAGVPLFFPIPIKGKLWWNVRVLPIKAGGAVENYIFIPVLIVLCVASAIAMSMKFAGIHV